MEKQKNIKPQISVIMPCLNMARYIEECMESIIHQTLENIEIIVVDAGSTDGTLDILEEYLHKDHRIKLFRSEKKSYGHQVNLGIINALGEYIAIVDADDRIVPDMYETLYPIAVKTGADYVKGAVDYFYTVKDKYIFRSKYMPFRKDEYGEGGIEIIPRQMPGLILKDNFLWYGIYRSDFFKRIRFHESPGAAYQDFGALLQTQLNAEKAVYIEKTVYEYRQDNMGASGYNPKAFGFIINEYDWSEAFLEGKTQEWHTAFYCKLFLHTLSRFYAMVYLGCYWREGEAALDVIKDRICHALDNGFIDTKNFNDLQQEYFQVFIKQPADLFKMLDKRWEPSWKEIQDVFQAIAGKDVVIFGGGQSGSFFHLLMLNNHMENVMAFCDNNDLLRDGMLHGLSILTPEEAASKYPDAMYVITNKKCSGEMKAQLIRFGIEDKNIVCAFIAKNINLFKRRLSLGMEAKK